jgi:hypothetical protein
MTPPDYKEAAMCCNCRFRAKNFVGLKVRCLKFDYLGALDHVCSDYDETDLDCGA